MKNILALLISLVAFSLFSKGQEAKPQMLPEPAKWEFEKFALPPVFAPSISYTGEEELRFAPGMFKKDAVDYFTYVFVARLDNVTAISETEIKDYLLKYYKGLCSVTAKDRKLVIDTTQISATINKKPSTVSNETSYDAEVNLFGVFADGAPVKLNLEINSISDTLAKKTYLFFIASPLDKKDPIWSELREVQKKSMRAVNK